MHIYLRTPTLLLVLAAPLACGDSGNSDSDSDADTTAATTVEPATDGTGAAPTTGDDPSTGLDPAAFYDCEETMFGSAPLAGPLFDAGNGGIQGELQPSYILHTTQIYIKPESRQTFDELANAIVAEAMQTEGLVAITVGGDAGCGVARTMGIWADEESLYKLVLSETHAEAVAMTTALSYTGRTTHWTATAEEANAYTWDVARARLADVEPSPIY